MENLKESSDLLAALSDGMADAVEKIAPKVVRVNGRRRRSASGVVYAPDTVLTASHVLEREEDLTVGVSDGRTLPARFVGRDPSSDLAVLRVEGLDVEAATPVEGPVRIGQLVLAVGSPGRGEGPRASLGVVSSVGGPMRTWRGPRLERYIQTDATPYPGFSGGPLIDERGNVLGIMTTGLAQRSGLLVVGVEDGSPAGRGGIIIGDILATLDGQPIADTEDLLVLLTGERVGREVPVQVVRGGELQTLQITVGERG